MQLSLPNDQDVVKERKNALKDVTVPLREQIVKKLVKKLEEQGQGERTIEIWNMANSHRAVWLDRQEELMKEYDEFMDPIYTATQEWSSTLHLPIAFTIAKTVHARFLAALLAIDPPFNVKARQEANFSRAPLIQELMGYTLKSWCNYNQGVDETVDAWLWSWVTTGCGIMKIRWDRKFSRYLDVEKQIVQGDAVFTVDPNTGQESVTYPPKEIEAEKEIVAKVYDGPCFEFRNTEDVVIVGGGGDPQNADEVQEQIYYTASELWTLVDQGIFDKEAVKEVIDGGENRVTGSIENQAKHDREHRAGTQGPDKEFDIPRYKVIERHCKLDVDGSGINSDIIMWVAYESRKILRATYLYRVNPEGLRPYFKIDFLKRHGQDYGIGIIELTYSLCKEIDAIHNIKVDFGILSSMPFGFYKPTASLSEERIPYEPGSLIPLDNPQSDVYFPQLGNRSAFGAQEEQMLMQQIERLTSISDLSLGVIGGQGATRTATGTRALLGESNANLDVFLRRMNRGWKRALVYLFHQLQHKLPPGFQFRLTGDDGHQYWETVKSRDELAGMYDFELEANSANSNKMIQIETANNIVQTIMNPLLIQTGIVSPSEIFEALKNKFQAEGIKDFTRYIRKPAGQVRLFTPEELANRVLAGTDVPLGPEQDLNGFIAYVSYLFEHDEILGQITEEQTIKLARAQQQAQAMQEAMEAQAAQQANQQQIQTNTNLAQSPSPAPQGGNPGIDGGGLGG